MSNLPMVTQLNDKIRIHTQHCLTAKSAPFTSMPHCLVVSALTCWPILGKSVLSLPTSQEFGKSLGSDLSDSPALFLVVSAGGESWRWTWCQESSAHTKSWPNGSLSTLGKVAMMRSRLTGGPKGVREDLIVPESPVDPIRGKRVRELCQSLETHPQVYAQLFSSFKKQIQASFSVSIGQRSSLSLCRQYDGVGGPGQLHPVRESRRPGSPVGSPTRCGPSELITGCEAQQKHQPVHLSPGTGSTMGRGPCS